MNNEQPRISRMPKQYQSDGLPFHWQDDESGELPAAVLVFTGPYRSRGWTPSAETIELLRDHLEYYINAPGWNTGGEEDTSGYHEDFTALRERVKTLRNAEEIDVWINDLHNMGIDPLEDGE